MRTTLIYGLALPLACTALLTACGSAEDPAAEIRRAQDDRGGSMQVSLDGCVEAAPGANQYVMRQVSMPPLAEQRSDASTAPGTGITEGSWVRLRGGDNDQLRDHIGERVRITGTIVDDGRNTIGTTGRAYGPNDAEPRKDESRAAAREHHAEKVRKESGPIGERSMNNGTAPEIAVQRVTATGEKCKG